MIRVRSMTPVVYYQVWQPNDRHHSVQGENQPGGSTRRYSSYNGLATAGPAVPTYTRCSHPNLYPSPLQVSKKSKTLVTQEATDTLPFAVRCSVGGGSPALKNIKNGVPGWNLKKQRIWSPKFGEGDDWSPSAASRTVNIDTCMPGSSKPPRKCGWNQQDHSQQSPAAKDCIGAPRKYNGYVAEVADLGHHRWGGSRRELHVIVTEAIR